MLAICRGPGHIAECSVVCTYLVRQGAGIHSQGPVARSLEQGVGTLAVVDSLAGGNLAGQGSLRGHVL